MFDDFLYVNVGHLYDSLMMMTTEIPEYVKCTGVTEHLP